MSHPIRKGVITKSYLLSMVLQAFADKVENGGCISPNKGVTTRSYLFSTTPRPLADKVKNSRRISLNKEGSNHPILPSLYNISILVYT